ncbi:MAG: hypothetical protein IPG71_01870 [bacterium]|nr:hypothetical protein [bacterium]
MTEHARFRIAGTVHSSISDTSDADVVIAAPSITMLSPTGGERWGIGNAHAVTWSSVGLTGEVAIELMRTFPSGTWESISSNTSNDGSHVWQVTGATTDSARVRLRSINLPTIGDTSGATLQIVQPTLALIHPQGGEEIIVGQSQNITWQSQDLEQPLYVYINRDYPNGPWTQLLSDIANDGTQEWVATGPAAQNCRMRIQASFNGAVVSECSSDFRIVAPSLTLVQPIGGEGVGMGSDYAIRWQAEHLAGTVRVELARTYPSEAWETIGTLAATDGEFPWIPEYPASTHCRIRVISESVESLGDTSAFDFVILPAPPDSLPGAPESPSPINGDFGVPASPLLSWAPAARARRYDLYLWTDSLNVPLAPVLSNTSFTYHSIAETLLAGHRYFWKVTAKNYFGEQSSSTWAFTARNLPDLVVDTVDISDAVSGQPLLVRWQVHNAGSGSTNTPIWYDRIWLSPDTTADIDEEEDILLGTFANVSALAPGEGYENVQFVQLPVDYVGNHYLFVISDNRDALFIDWNTHCAWTHAFGPVLESNECNNFAAQEFAIAAAPTADLRVTDLLVSRNDAIAGDTLLVSWTVANSSPTAPAYPAEWVDAVLLSGDALVDSSDFVLASIAHEGGLAAMNAYQDSALVVLPMSAHGPLYVIVDSDRDDVVFEYLNESNNATLSDSIYVNPAPWPDLAANEVTIPLAATNRETIPVGWTVSNQGRAATTVSYWIDRVYLSEDTVFQSTEDAILASVVHQAVLELDSSYSVATQIELPNGVSGLYYVLIAADYNDHVFEYTDEHSNLKSSPFPIEIISPNLAAVYVNAPDVCTAGDTIQVNWGVYNAGGAPLLNGQWRDRLFLSPTQSVQDSLARAVGRAPRSGDLLPGSIYDGHLDVSVPVTLSGAWYLHLRTDDDDWITESGFEEDNVGFDPMPIQIDVRPWADLLVTELFVPDSATAGANLELEFTVQNAGAASATAPLWTDKVYYSSSPSWNLANAVYIGELQFSGSLPPAGEYSKLAVWSIPNSVSGNVYIYVRTDANNSVYEYTADSNNVFRSPAIHIDAYPPVDLVVLSGHAPEAAESGSMVEVQWTVANAGLGRTVNPSWLDEVVLSEDTLFQHGQDQLVQSVIHTGHLNAGQSYVSSRQIMIPNGLTGVRYLIIRSAMSGGLQDVELANNSFLVTPPIEITLAPSPDLKLDYAIASGNLIAGHPVQCQWAIVNQGLAPAPADDWSDALVLSLDGTADGGDILLAAYGHVLPLAAAAAETLEAAFVIPSYVSGNYYIIAITDDLNSLYEGGNESNNSYKLQVNIAAQQPADLIVHSIAAPAAANAGDTVVVSWVIENTGMHSASGILRNGVYLSSDATWDISDHLMAIDSQFVNLLPTSHLTATAALDLSRSLSSHENDREADREQQFDTSTTILPGVTPGDYRVVVRTDLTDLIRETDNGNNANASTGSISVAIAELALGDSAIEDLGARQARYYKVSPAANQDLRFDFVTDQPGAVNELLVSFNGIPNLFNYEYRSENSFSPAQQVLIPVGQETECYVALVARSLPPGIHSERIALRAAAQPFALLSVSPAEGGSNGSVTVTLRGGRLDESMEAFLLSEDTQIPGKIISVENRTKAIVNWDLRGRPEREYDIRIATPAAQTADLVDGFNVAPPRSGLDLSIEGPSTLRTGRPYRYNLSAVNDGNVDLVDSRVLAEIPAGMGYRIGHDQPFVFPSEDEIVELHMFHVPTGMTQSVELEVYPVDTNFYSGIAVSFVGPGERLGIESDRVEQSEALLEDTSVVLNQVPWGDCGEYAAALLRTPDAVCPGYFDYFRAYSMSNVPLGDAWGIRSEEGQVALFWGRMGITNENQTVPGSGRFELFSFGDLLASSVQMWTGEMIRFEYRYSLLPTVAGEMPAFANRAQSHLHDVLGVDNCFCTHPVFDDIAHTCLVCYNECTSSFDQCMRLGSTANGIAVHNGKIPDVMRVWLVDNNVLPELTTEVLANYNESNSPDSLWTIMKRRNRNGRRVPIRIVGSQDPNSISGPVGYGQDGYLGKSALCSYTINFENLERVASAPAQIVRVNQIVDTTLDLGSIRLRSFGFANLTFNIPGSVSHYSERLDVQSELGLYVDVTASVNHTTHGVHWVFECLDPATLRPPLDPLQGFLPVNDPELHNGEGFVSYSARIADEVMSGDTIFAEASITFDNNDPLRTEFIFNIVDAIAPFSAMDSLITAVNETTVVLKWSATDELPSSGVAGVDLYESRNDGPYTLIEVGLVDTFLVYSGRHYNGYRWHTVAMDNAGNRESAKTGAEADAYFVPTLPAQSIGDLVISLSPAAGNGGVRLIWCAITSDTAGNPVDIDEYRIYSMSSHTGYGGEWVQVGATTDSTFEYMIQPNELEPIRYFRVQAITERAQPLRYAPQELPVIQRKAVKQLKRTSHR